MMEDKAKGKTKMKVGNKFKKKGKKKKDFAKEEAEHHEYCEVCQQGNEYFKDINYLKSQQSRGQ